MRLLHNTNRNGSLHIADHNNIILWFIIVTVSNVCIPTSLLVCTSFTPIPTTTTTSRQQLLTITKSTASVTKTTPKETLFRGSSISSLHRTKTTTTTRSTTSLHSSSLSTVEKDCIASTFNLSTALLCGGLAFDAYVEPAPDSSRWERGSQGFQVAFCSSAYTRQLYKGLIEIQVQKCTGLPETEDSTAERLLSGDGVDACLLVAIIEGGWKEDVQMLEKEQYHTGVLDLSGAAHVTRSSTCWSSVDEKRAEASYKKNGKALPYHVKSGWGKGAQAIWPETEPPFYLYVQDPSTARLVFTVLDDDKLGSGTAVGSTYKKLSELIPTAALNQKDMINTIKEQVLAELKRNGGNIDQIDDTMKKQLGSASKWEGSMKLTSKPRKKSKNNQIFAGAVAGAAIAGPAGAAAGALFGSFYEGQVQGSIHLKLRYLPIPDIAVTRNKYTVTGGMPGINWGTLYEKYQYKALSETGLNMADNNEIIDAETDEEEEEETAITTEDEEEETVSSAEDDDRSMSTTDINNIVPGITDLEHCFFVNHQKTGATCAVYRSIEHKLIIVSFRGTCAPIDLLTDASLVQEAWVEGDDIDNQLIPKVHVGFRTSLNSIARRLKELILAVPAPGDSISDYDMLVTGHSLGGALATLFTADIGQYGIDAGRALPQQLPSEPWWKGVANIFAGGGGDKNTNIPVSEPPRPKSLRLYNFGSPRVGNTPFAELFDALRDEGFIDDAYRIVNGEDVVARLPRTVNALVFGNINYEHVGTTVLLSQPEQNDDGTDTVQQRPSLWIEGVSDNNRCPVRDGVSLSSPMAEGSLLSDLFEATKESFTAGEGVPNLSWTDKLTSVAGKVTERMKQMKASDLASIVGIDKSFTDRELRIVQSLMQGKALAHHMEDEYYAGMGHASGFLARVGEDIVELET